MENQNELIMNELRALHIKLDKMMAPKKEVVQSDLMDVTDACTYLNLGKSSIYKMSSSNLLPVIRRQGVKKIQFSRTALNDWSTSTTTGPYNLQVNEYLHKSLKVQKVQKN